MNLADLEQSPTYQIPLDRMHASGLNPRKHVDKAKLAELADNIKAVGVLQPILVRPNADGYEIVFGERRYRAAKLAGLASLPAHVRELSTVQVLELQVYENAQRADVHPLEESDAFARLHKPPKGADYPAQPIEEIAAKAGKSRAYVYQALKLQELGDVGRKLFLEGKLSKSVADLVARIQPEKLQNEAAKELSDGEGGTPFREAFRIVKQDYALALEGCGFDLTDAQLVPKAGPCTTCPKRTANQLELLGEAKSPDVCMDRVCFKSKQDAAWQKTAAAAEAKGLRVLEEEKAQAAFRYNSEYADLEERAYEDPKQRTYKQLAPKDAQVYIARDDRGRMRKLVKKSDLPRIERDEPWKKTRTAERKKQERRRAVTTAAIAAIVEKAKGGDAFWRVIIDCFVRGGYHDAIGEVVKRRGWAEKGKQAHDVFKKHAGTLKADQLPRLALEVVITDRSYGTYYTGVGESITAAAKAFGVDLKAIEKRVAGELAEKKTKKKAPVKAA